MKRNIVISLCVLGVIVLAGVYQGKTNGASSYPEPDTIKYNVKQTEAALGTQENPFTVLEIVPDQSMATVGYMIPGCEPVKDLQVDVTGAMEQYKQVFAGQDTSGNLVNPNGVSTVTDKDICVFRTDLSDQLGFDPSYVSSSLTVKDTDSSFGQFGYFQQVAEGEVGDYKFVAPTNPNEIGYFLPVAAGDPQDQLTYQWIPLVSYEENLLGTGAYIREGNRYSNELIDISATPTDAYYSFALGVGIGTITYDATDLVSNVVAEMPEQNPDLTLQLEEVGSDKDKPGMRYYQFRCEENYVCYVEQKIEHTDSLIQSIFPGQSTEAGFVSQVVSVTPAQLSGKNVTGVTEEGVTYQIIEDADLIVIHDSAVAQGIYNAATGTVTAPVQFAPTLDLTVECFDALVKRQASGKPAMMWLDESATDKCLTDPSNSRNPLEIEKLYTIMNRYGAKYYYNVYGPDKNGVTEKDPNANGGEAFVCNSHSQGMHIGKTSNCFCWNSDSFLTDKISTEPNAALGNESVAQVLEKSYVASTGAEVKKKLHVLELQPIATFIYGQPGWKSYYLSLFPDFVGTSCYIEDDVTVTCMATYEFNGKIEDMNAKYDAVVIGSSQDETNGLNGYNDKNLAKVAYATLGDLVSTYRGDIYFIDSNFFAMDKLGSWGLYDEDVQHWIKGRIGSWNWSSFSQSFIGAEQGSDIGQANIRYSATDVTKKKFLELVEFAQKQPISIDERLYETSSGTPQVDKEFVDESSFVYQLAQMGLVESDYYVVPHTSVEQTDRDNVSKQILNTQCDMVFSDDGTQTGENGKPVEYKATYGKKNVRWGSWPWYSSETINDALVSSTSNNQVDEQGKPVLRYHFTLQGKADAKYRVRIYLDSNGNGIFEENECSLEPIIFEESMDGIQGFIGNGDLKANHTYTITRQLPENEAGMLPWKIVVNQVGLEGNRDSATGYTRLLGSGQKETIKVLQMNLSPTMANNGTDIIFERTNEEIGAKFKAYLDNVEDYNVELDSRNNEWFMKNYNGKPEQFTSFLQEYDMLILGFEDMASFTGNATYVEGFKNFVAAGKSVILSHDMVQDRSFYYPNYESKDTLRNGTCWTIGEKNAAYLRDLAGQITYYNSNATEEGSYEYTYSRGKKVSTLPRSDLKVAYFYEYNVWRQLWIGSRYMTQKDYMYRVPGIGEYTTNLMDNSNRTMLFTSRVAQNDFIDRVIVNPSNNNSPVGKTTLGWPYSCETTTVKVANQGQITTYPYTMGDTISVGKTHAQNFKLNLESDFAGAMPEFDINGSYTDWNKVPKKDTGYNAANGVANQGTAVRLNNKVYGYVRVNDNNKAQKGAEFRTFAINIGDQISVQVNPLKVAEDGTITKNPSFSNMKNGQHYEFYFGNDSFGVAGTTNINDIKENQWNGDAVFGRYVVTPGADYDQVEYEFDLEAILTYYNKWRGTNVSLQDVDEIKVNFHPINTNEEQFSTKETEDYLNRIKVPRGDTIVWYNLSNSSKDKTNIYSAKEGDSANNYYIYTKDNITYTGLGHSGKMTNDEIRLFVNTMISAYRSQSAAPYVTVLNQEATQNAGVSTIYVEDRGEDTKDAVVKLLISDDSVGDFHKTYELTVKDEENHVVLDHVKVNKDQIYELVVTKETFQNAAKTYTVTLESSYQAGDKINETSRSTTVRVMTLPLFGLR